LGIAPAESGKAGLQATNGAWYLAPNAVTICVNIAIKAERRPL
jgi:hypothetical protein